VSLDDDHDADPLDGPACFIDAAEAFIDWYPLPKPDEERLRERVAARVAETLSRLARAGLIISVELHDEICDGYAQQLLRVETATDDLLSRIEGEL
jgi:hypothetical protein